MYTVNSISTEKKNVWFIYDYELNGWRPNIYRDYDHIINMTEQGILDPKYLDMIQLTYDEVLALEVDRNTDIPPTQYYLYDGSAEPGTWFDAALTTTTTSTTTTATTTTTTTTTTTVTIQIEYTPIPDQYAEPGMKYTVTMPVSYDCPYLYCMALPADNSIVDVINCNLTDDNIIEIVYKTLTEGEATIEILLGAESTYLTVPFKVFVSAQTTAQTTSSTTTSTSTTTSSDVTTPPSTTKPVDHSPGDINDDGIVDASDASAILKEYAALSTRSPSTLSSSQRIAANVNFDDVIDASDASTVLRYYAYRSTGGELDIMKFIETV